ncbi:hypothetical protein [Conexibacter sp. CPCC 206217]|uniref:hypothetical protein n=1 Tax=Conexibacter sp. CPCC 206217 TaxID=3064574 RepID=UPI0027293550|nr:hypothetical protein [Conexibacter sp. CPCC 206217]MDO8211570.1 hypothetical protein [Conexibacter sp. CPCC 206217]
MHHRTRLLTAAVVTLMAIVPASANAAARRTSTSECPIFTVVQNDPQSGFSAGKYHRLNFAPAGVSLTCDDTYHIFRSYLYEPRSMAGWTTQKLGGSLRTATGKRFVKRGTNGRVGFDVWRFPKGVTPPAGA